MVARVGGQLLQRQRVLGETGAPEADPGAQEARADAAVEADPLRDAHDVGAGRLADVRDLVDERDARHQGGVGGELDHLRRRDIAADDGALDTGVQRRDGVPVLLAECADDDPVGVEEVGDRGALGGELRVRGVADLLEAALVEAVTHPAGRFRPARCSSSRRRSAGRSPAARRSRSRRRRDRRRPSTSAACRPRRRRTRRRRSPRRRRREAEPLGVPRDRARASPGS